MSDPGTGDGPSRRSKRSRKAGAKPADDVAAPKPETGGATGDRPKSKRSNTRSSRKASGAADTGATGAASDEALTASIAGAPTASSAPSLDAVAPNEEIPLVLTREEITVSEDGDEVEIRIRRRAYEIYLERGGVRGDPLADWIRAEREVRSRGP